jgi:hypothetical protein
MITLSQLSARKPVLEDLPPSDYDHHAQARTNLDPKNPFPASDTMFDGEKQ